MTFPTKHRVTYGQMVLVALFVSAPTRLVAQSSETPAAASVQPANPPAKGELGDSYTDGSFGFSVRPLAGAVIHRYKRNIENDLQLCQFVRMDHRWSMSVRYANPSRPIGAEGLMKERTIGLALQYVDLQTVRAEPVRVCGREAARCELKFTSEQQMWLRQEAVVRTRPAEFFILLLVTPATDEELARAAFGGMLESFEVLRSEAIQQQIDAALLRGIGFMRDVADRHPDITAGVHAENYLRIMRAGQEIGFVEILEAPGTIRDYEGIQILQRVWLFEEDGSFQFTQEQKFVARDLSFEEWDKRTHTVQRTKDERPRVSLAGESAIRQDNQLLVTYFPKSKTSADKEKAIEVESSYAPVAWGVLLPRLVDLAKPELYAFSMYDGERRGLALRTYRVVGPIQATIAGRATSAFKIEESDGLIPPVSELYVDQSGRILRVWVDPVEMLAAPRVEVEALYRQRVDEAHALLRTLAGQTLGPTDGRTRQATPVSPRRP